MYQPSLKLARAGRTREQRTKQCRPIDMMHETRAVRSQFKLPPFEWGKIDPTSNGDTNLEVLVYLLQRG